MRVGIVANNNLMYLPYLDKYIKIIERAGADYQLLSWDRLHIEDPEDKERYQFCRYYAPITNSKIGKVRDYYNFYKYLKQMINDNRYDRLIVFTSQVGVMISRILLRDFKKRYILDIRDYTYEKIPVYRQITSRLIDESIFTVISSAGFKKWLPQSSKYFVTHNININHLGLEVKGIDKDSFSGKIVINFVGMIRYYKENINLIKSLANNDRFEIGYAGTGHCEGDLKDYCEKNSVSNVVFHGSYKTEEKSLLYEQATLINSLYGVDETNSLTLIPNRLYECCLFKRPILVSKGSYLAELVEEYELGLVIDLEKDSISEKIEEYAAGFDHRRYQDSCSRFLEVVKREEEIYTAAVESVLNAGNTSV